jgi:hypothetical protein
VSADRLKMVDVMPGPAEGTEQIESISPWQPMPGLRDLSETGGANLRRNLLAVVAVSAGPDSMGRLR